MTPLQERIETLYAPNHSYNLDTLQGTNAESVERIEFFKNIFNNIDLYNKTVLDIGANKGIFSIICYLKGANKIISQDTDPVYTNLLSEIYKYKN